MAKHTAVNERIKREYLAYLKEAKGRDEATIDRVAASLARFEDSTGRRDFKRFHHEQAVAFKRRLGEAINAKTGQPRSKATIHSTLRDLKAFFFWLAHLPGFKKQIAYDDCEYFNLSEKDVAIARASREKAVPSLEQVAAVLAAMPAATVLERRDRALVAFTAITGWQGVQRGCCARPVLQLPKRAARYRRTSIKQPPMMRSADTAVLSVGTSPNSR